MIIQDKTDFFSLLITLQGSVLPHIIVRVIGFTIFSIVLVLWDQYLGVLPNLAAAPFAVFGIALSLFLGFRNNAAYDRWWEGRRLWGQLIADSRTLARELDIFITDQTAREDIIRTMLTFVHLHRVNLRQLKVDDFAAQWKAGDFMNTPHPPCAALNKVAELMRDATEDGFAKRALAERLASVTLVQAACERIVSTPLPYVYTLLVFRTTCLYCALMPFALISSVGWYTPLFVAIIAYMFFGLAAVTEELSNPFKESINGLPLDAMCRTIEVSLAPHLDIPTPAPWQAKGYYLS